MLEKDRQLGDISGRYWREIDREAYDFDSRQKLANAVRHVSRDELLATFRKAVLERRHALRVVTGTDQADAITALTRLTQQPPVPAS
ncbi:MAG: hypothetical protein EP328_11130 [Gammaproteobacteria bacterium]|nr:MAG: hypothetical protein EP328_11130 [Gammaproteobacteria bacterium]